ncbi:hypothetical protein OHA25_11615 [Nonomuraea sp. NBC_00507]|uniref:hypothetical protein n=1 Tax=Nonomuraea sp. NBC_00507 TaxID=2976002 RepID=UPI002E19469F
MIAAADGPTSAGHHVGSLRRRPGNLVRVTGRVAQDEPERQRRDGGQDGEQQKRGEGDARLELVHLYCLHREFDRAEKETRAALRLDEEFGIRWKEAAATTASASCTEHGKNMASPMSLACTDCARASRTVDRFGGQSMDRPLGRSREDLMRGVRRAAWSVFGRPYQVLVKPPMFLVRLFVRPGWSRFAA